jgi:hypothetical protein
MPKSKHQVPGHVRSAYEFIKQTTPERSPLNPGNSNRQYEEDVKRCKQCDPEQRRECYKQAMELWVACRTGRDIPPLFPDEPWLRSK